MYDALLKNLAAVCDRIAKGQYQKARELFELTRDDKHPPLVAGLAEAFGMMLVKVEAHKFQLERRVEDLEAVKRELEHALALESTENSRIKRDLRKHFTSSGIVGGSAGMCELLRQVERVADTPLSVLILGETGTGKELVAKTLHYNSARAAKPFVAINCAAIPEGLLESELFGIKGGVASGVTERTGRFEQADGGTLFLDEVGDMPLESQAKILRVLETRQFEQVGGRKSVTVDVRIVAATHRNLRQGRLFREDLYYRLSGVTLHIPPLRERQEDIALLATTFAKAAAARMNLPQKIFTPEALALLEAYPWPGNVRELLNEVERAVVLSVGTAIAPADLSPDIRAAKRQKGPPGVFPAFPPTISGDFYPKLSSLIPGRREDRAYSSFPAPSLPEQSDKNPHSPAVSLHDTEKSLILETLARTGNNKSSAARQLGISREGLRKKLLRYGLTGENEPSFP